MSITDDVVVITTAIFSMRDEVEKRFCSQGAPCQAKFNCFHEGKRDFSRCPLFGKPEQEVLQEVRKEIQIAVILGDLEE